MTNVQTGDLTAKAFARLGEHAIAYVKTISLTDAQRLFPELTDIPPRAKLFALLAADGSPIVLTNSKEAAIASAWRCDLKTVSVH